MSWVCASLKSLNQPTWADGDLPGDAAELRDTRVRGDEAQLHLDAELADLVLGDLRGLSCRCPRCPRRSDLRAAGRIARVPPARVRLASTCTPSRPPDHPWFLQRSRTRCPASRRRPRRSPGARRDAADGGVPRALPPRVRRIASRSNPAMIGLAHVGVVERLHLRVQATAAHAAVWAMCVWALYRVTACLSTVRGGREVTADELRAVQDPARRDHRVVVALEDLDLVQVRRAVVGRPCPSWGCARS